MSLLPPAVEDGLAARFGPALSATPLTGGDVNQAALVTAGVERLVVKWKADAPPGLFDAAYHAAFALDAGYERRRPLHQLYPLLIHLNHFGETYGPAVDRACRESVG